jgi:hypothetical protein
MPKYQINNAQGVTLATIPDVLAPVALTGVTTSAGSNLVTVASTSDLHAGMPVAIPNMPENAVIHAVKDGTTIELFASRFTGGAWTHSAANAQATASDNNLQGRAYGFHAGCVVRHLLPKGMWRNTIRANAFPTATLSNVYSAPGNPWVNAPGFNNGTTTLATMKTYLSDELSDSPVKRENGETWGFYPMVQTSGLLSRIPADEDLIICCTAVA